MFHGSIPEPLRAIIYEHAGAWPGTDIYVGCSGNFTIERVLHARFGAGRTVHGCDIQAYSCALGWWLAGQPLSFTLREDHEDALGWLSPYLDGATGTLATLMLGTRFLQWVGKDGPYFRRMLAATQDQWPTMHAKTVAKLEALTLRLGSFYAGDVREYLDTVVPDDAPVVMFPPFYAGDYTSQFASLDHVFAWPAPTYGELDEDAKEDIIARVAHRPSWMLGLHVERDEMREHLAGIVQTANRGLPIYVYAAAGPRRIVAPRQQTRPVLMQKLGPDDELGDRMALHILDGGQFAALRSQFMSKTILPGSPLLACAVSVDGHVIGAFAYKSLAAYSPTCGYLLSDFPVSWTRYRRLAKLVVMAGISREARLLVERSVSKRLTEWTTTAFSDNPNSAKYSRGIPGSRLLKRTEPGGDGIHRYQLQYGGPLGELTLPEALAYWKTKHGADQR